MCGIAGIIDRTLAPGVVHDGVDRMCAAMVHRGPTDGGVAELSSGCIGMRRLAIFDPANGRQPMETADGRYTIVFNGAIYNHRDLRKELEALGGQFRTHCDTEVLLHAFAQWGSGCLRRLRGMFAFAIWDRVERRLTLARDFFGIKPLHFASFGADGLIFASELNALRASRCITPEIDPGAVSLALAYLAVPAPRTIYRGVRALRPGEWAEWKDGIFRVSTYWDFRDLKENAQRPCTSVAEFQEELRARLEDTIAAHCLADVPVGAFLSGGLDSSAVVGLMSRQMSGQLKTFSIVFDETDYSEQEEARAAARHFGTDHQELVLSGARVAGDIEAMVRGLDRPTGDGVNTYYASLLAQSGGVTVALSGLGGDELFGGYPWFNDTPKLARWHRFWGMLPRPARELVLRSLARQGVWQQKLADFLAHGGGVHAMAALQRRNFPEAWLNRLLSSPHGFEAHSELPHLMAEVPEGDPREIVSAWEMRAYMGDVLLRDSDFMSMRHSLELRVPLVDRPLIEWLSRQPAQWRFAADPPKAALFGPLERILPPGMRDRPKRGFTLPFALWMKRELRPFLEHTYSVESVGRSGLFNTQEVCGYWQHYLTGNDTREWSRVWTLAIVIAFVNRPSAS